MKRITLLLPILVLFVNAFSSVAPPAVPKIPVLNAKNFMIPVGKSGKTISLMELSTIERSELETLTGKKMNWMQRMAFNKTQKRLKKGINADGVVTDKKVLKAFHKKGMGDETGFHGLGFVLGFVLGIIGVVLAYVIDDNEDKKNRVKWAWIGFGISVVLTVLLYVILFAALYSHV